MEKALKIAIYSGKIPSTTFIERLINGVAKKGHYVILFGALNHKPKYNSRVYILGYGITKIHKLLYLLKYVVLLFLFKNKDKRKLDRILKIKKRFSLYSKVKYYPVLWHKPDIFHLQWAKGIAEWEWVQQFGIKLVLSLRGAHINYSPIADLELAAQYRHYFTKVDGFHAVSKAISLEAQQYGALSDRIAIVYSGLTIDDNLNNQNLKFTSERFKIISVGRPHWKKGYTYALDACKLLKESDFCFEYVIVGGANTIEYQYQIHDLDLTNVVTLLEQQPYEIVQKMISEADLLLLPSVEEGIANVVLEAMSLETLVLSTNCGGMDEVIEDGQNGFLVPIRDSKSMAKRIQVITQLSANAKQDIMRNAKSTVLNQHNNEQMVNGMLTLYHTVINFEQV